MSNLIIGLALFIIASITEIGFRRRDFNNTTDGGVVEYETYSQMVIHKIIRRFMLIPAMIAGLFLLVTSLTSV